MKIYLVLMLLSTLGLSAGECHKKNKGGTEYKGRLEIKALCMNYTISLLEGDLDSSLLVANWTDESANKVYKNVFALGNPCNFPKHIEQGDEFYFEIDTSGQTDCLVCTAYYPKPPKEITIKVLEK